MAYDECHTLSSDYKAFVSFISCQMIDTDRSLYSKVNALKKYNKIWIQNTSYYIMVPSEARYVMF